MLLIYLLDEGLNLCFDLQISFSLIIGSDITLLT